MAEPYSLVAELSRIVNECLIKKPAKSADDSIDFCTTEALSVYNIIAEMLKDFQSMRIFSVNLVFKEFVLSVISDLVRSSQNYQFKKKCLILLKCLMDRDYDHQTYSFLSDELKEIYGKTMFKLATTGNLSEMILEQSLYSNTGREEERVDYDCDDEIEPEADQNSNEYRDQQRFLALIKFTLKCVDIKCLLGILSLTKVHYRFLIVNFSLSPQIPKIVEALTSNLCEPKLYKVPDTGLKPDDRTIAMRINSFYQISLKSSRIFFKENRYNDELLDYVMKIHQNISDYVARIVEAKKRPKWRRLIYDALRPFVLEFESESNAKYRRLNYRLIYYYTKVIHIHYDKITIVNKERITNNVVSSMKRVLARIYGSRQLRQLAHDEIKAYNQMISLFIHFIKKYNKMEIEKTIDDFTFALIQGIKSNNELVLTEITSMVNSISLKETKSNERIFEGKEFFKQVINSMSETLEKEGVVMVKNQNNFVQTCSDLVLALADFYPGVDPNTGHSEISKPIELIWPLLKLMSTKSGDFLTFYLEFSVRILRNVLNDKIKMGAQWEAKSTEIIEFIFEMVNSSFDFELSEKHYLACLRIINLLSCKKSKTKQFLAEYQETIEDVLQKIELNVDLKRQENKRSLEVFNKLINRKL